MKSLTVFTPTYNRLHTLSRTFDSLCCQSSHDFDWLVIDDGSTDGTRNWIESLGQKTVYEGPEFDSMGCHTRHSTDNHFVIEVNKNLCIEYVYKPNGGLYTGYNVAYQTIKTELCVCIDSDDFMPVNAVELILGHWAKRDLSINYCGLVGLDFNVVDKKPIGGNFPQGINDGFYMTHLHGGDTKHVLRVDLMRMVAPQIGYDGEKDFNPFYMMMQILDQFPILFVNENFCWVEYQLGLDSMSQGIWKQYIRSPRSYAKYRIAELNVRHGMTFKRRIELCIHYVSACILSKDKDWLHNSPFTLLTLLVAPLGALLSVFVKYKNYKK